MKFSPEILKKVGDMPHSPGVYQYFDNKGELIYVGKAKDLRKRVSSYFRNDVYGKTAVLVKRIFDIKFVVVETEHDALLLENSLIKQNQPRYNINLKDDKTYPWICIKNEPFPRVFKTRNLVKDGSQYFGPYSSVFVANTILDFIKELYKLRTCKYLLIPENIRKGKFKECLEHHIGNCNAPCVSRETQEEYMKSIYDVRKILRGNVSEVKKHFEKIMFNFSENLEFEKAEAVRQKIYAIDNYQSKSKVVSNYIGDLDVFGFLSEDSVAYVNFFKVANGSIVQFHTVEMKMKVEEEREDLLAYAILDMRKRGISRSKEMIVPFEIDGFESNTLIVPRRGDKKSLLDMAERNLKYYRLERIKQGQKLNKKQRDVRLLTTMQKELQLEKIPMHIECFDNSNIQGHFPVASCVVFKNTVPSKKDYRKFNIKTVEGPDDFASMEEVVYRRYKRLIDEDGAIPDLIVVDGGKGQLGSAVRTLDRLDFQGKRPAIIGIAKRLEEIFKPGDPVPIYIDKNSETLKVIQHLRNEAHRFGITFHRDKRSKSFTHSELENIKGIGSKTIDQLLLFFKSEPRVRAAEREELIEVVGQAKAQLIMKHYRNKNRFYDK